MTRHPPTGRHIHGALEPHLQWIGRAHRLHDLAGLCDLYVFLLPHHVTVLRAHEIVSVGPVTAEHLVGVFDRLRGGAMLLRATP